jgi:NADH:ubiquinone oxidoreductase subunit 4 (subunit M)
MGGMAFRAPALAALLLILAFANLAMPGTANFVGELLILFGAFEDKFTWGLIAAIGVVLASVYMIRFFIRAMHNAPGEGVVSSEACALELGVIAPVAAVIVALGVYPQVILDGTEQAFEPIAAPRGERDPMTDLLLAADIQGPEIDYAGSRRSSRSRRHGGRPDGGAVPRRLRAAHPRARRSR